MAGGNRAFTLQDVLGQLNQDASGQSSQDDSALQINQLAVLSDGVAVADAVTVTAGATSGKWAQIITSSPSIVSSPSVISGALTGGFKWGAAPWS